MDDKIGAKDIPKDLQRLATTVLEAEQEAEKKVGQKVEQKVRQHVPPLQCTLCALCSVSWQADRIARVDR